MNGDQLQHSAKGTTWSKKDHKYIRKEGDKYIYDERTTNVGKKLGSQVPSSTKMKAMIAANKGLQVLKKIGIAESNKQKAKEIEKINKKTAEKLATSDWERLKKRGVDLSPEQVDQLYQAWDEYVAAFHGIRNHVCFFRRREVNSKWRQ